MPGAPDVPIEALGRRTRSEPDRQVEIQLGHLCNNRCVFCVSGQRTERGQAGVSEYAPILAEVRAARARGHTKITLLGGEPTLQPAFLPLLRECAALGFEQVVIFTNGAKTASGKLIDEAVATGAKIAFRVSIQGASEESHERTTKKDGSFARIVRTLEHLEARGLDATVNTCLVASNHEDIERFASWLVPLGVRQLHVDLMRPLDAGDRSEDDLARTLAPLDRIGPELTAMVRAFPADFDVNVGNLPFCLAPEIADRIHHDGTTTETIAADGETWSQPWNKYEVKRRDKVKPAGCAECAFDAHCSGIYAHYLAHQGTAALVPVRGERLASLDPTWLAVQLRPLVRRLEVRACADGVAFLSWPEELRAIALEVGGSRIRFVQRAERALARYPGFEVEGAIAPREARWLATALAAEGLAPIVPLAAGVTARPLAAALSRLSRDLHLGPLAWRSTELGEDQVVLELGHGSVTVRVTLGLDGAGRVAMRYALEGEPTGTDREALRLGLGRLMGQLRGGARGARSGA